MYDLSGKVALVTGASGQHGIGRAIALRLAREGADVVVNDLHAAAGQPRQATPAAWGGLPAVVQDIQALGRRALGIEADITDASQVQSMVDQIVGELGRLDILVNNAGAPAGRDRVPVVELEEADFDQVLRVNLKGTFLCSRAAARVMVQGACGGKIIMLSSTRGKQGVARYAAYCASKFAVIGFAQSLALELAADHINVNVICPGMVDTERLETLAQAVARPGETPRDAHARLLRERAQVVPLGRVADGDDVANTAAFLASSQSDYLTGLCISVSGGTLMH